ncbi:hypothetical protein OG233_11000 [Streptomyces sp. NBC_01218]|uniref:hypothetical protein n=1 Tax=unclassified Streptomyces TaxID=2593676 RepID=UPI0023B90E1E|nr:MULTISPECIES: hypothetical protein [unclassified Streptomyces]WEH39973.1 hypothetical protein PZB77_10845 [Streptomyces sp. AM 2-1-1]WSQ51664.1 hypothetical protein OG233_11000 [Streptomyces sp. NBC_01218]
MTITRRTLLTVSVAGVVLGALCFVPSAKNTDDTSSRTGPARSAGHAPVQREDESYGSSSRSFAQAGAGSGTGTTPYLIGGTVLLGLGAGYVARSDRRSSSPA